MCHTRLTHIRIITNSMRNQLKKGVRPPVQLPPQIKTNPIWVLPAFPAGLVAVVAAGPAAVVAAGPVAVFQVVPVVVVPVPEVFVRHSYSQSPFANKKNYFSILPLYIGVHLSL